MTVAYISHMLEGTTRKYPDEVVGVVNCGCLQVIMSLYTRVTLWLMGGKLANIIYFVVIVGANMFRPLEEIVSLSLREICSIETNK